MLGLRSIGIAGFCFALSSAWPAFAAEPVGQATLIRTEVSGQGGPLIVNDEVHRNERIRTSQSGLGQFVFHDGTKLAVGWGSSVVIDKYVFDDTDSVKRLTIKAAKGTFRWVSGNSKSSAYQIQTPAGTIGVRGTAFDFYVGPDGTTAVVLLNGAATFCGPGGCRQLQQRCDCVIARPNGNMTDTQTVNSSVLQRLGNQRALPFLSGNQSLTGGLGMLGGCRMASVAPERKDRTREPPRSQERQREPDPQPQQKQQDAPKQQPANPVKDRPHHDKPHHDKPHHDKPHHDRPDRGWHDKHDGHSWKDRRDRHDRHDDRDGPSRHGRSDHADRNNAPDRPTRTERTESHHDKSDRQEAGSNQDQTGSNERNSGRNRNHDRQRGWGGNESRNWNRDR